MTTHPCPTRLLLPEALSGRLDPAEEQRVMAHLETCATCQEAADDIEISLVGLAMLRSSEPAQPLASSRLDASASAAHPLDVVSLADRRRRPRLRTWLVGAAAAAVLVGAGIGVGYQLLPPRDGVEYGAAVALTPPTGAADASARGSVSIGEEGQALAVHLNAHSLPKAGWYECVWMSQGQTRSAGSFRATAGTADVELRVAPPQGATQWDLQVLAHTGPVSTVVLQGSATYSP